jgi:hypothetical protein
MFQRLVSMTRLFLSKSMLRFIFGSILVLHTSIRTFREELAYLYLLEY